MGREGEGERGMEEWRQRGWIPFPGILYFFKVVKSHSLLEPEWLMELVDTRPRPKLTNKRRKKTSSGVFYLATIFDWNRISTTLNYLPPPPLPPPPSYRYLLTFSRILELNYRGFGFASRHHSKPTQEWADNPTTCKILARNGKNSQEKKIINR